MKSPICLSWILPLCLIGLAACSRREEPPTPSSTSHPAPAVAEPLRSATFPDSAPANPAPPPPPEAGANLDKVAEQAAAFEDMVEALRRPADAKAEFNTDTLDLESFIQGKSERDLLKFGEAAQFTRPYAALPVLESLFRHSPDPQIRMEAAILFGDTAALFGYLKDRAVARECADRLIEWRGDAAFTSTLSPGARGNLLASMHRIVAVLDMGNSAWMQMAAALRKNPLSVEDLSIADAFEATARFRSGRAEDIPAMRALYESIRARGVYAEAYAQRDLVDRVLAWSDDEAQVQQAQWQEILAGNRAFEERLRSIDHLPPAQRLAELQRLNREEVQP